MIDHNHIYDLLPVYALGCLESDEADLISEHLAACEKCHSRLTAYRQAVNLLAYGAPSVSPPSNLNIKILRRVGTASDLPGKSQHPSPRWQGSFWWPHFSPAWAVAGLVIIVVLAVINLIQWQINTQSTHTGAISELLIIKMKGTFRAPEGDGTFVISQDRQQGVLVASDLPVLDEGLQYQLWMVKDGQIISGGIFSVLSNGYATVKIYAKELLTNFQSFEVTVEPTGGSPKPGDYLVMVSRH